MKHPRAMNSQRIMKIGYFQMKSDKGILYPILLFILMRVILFPFQANAHTKLLVITSVFPLQEFAQAIGGERVKVDILLPPGAEPHTWEPKPSDIMTIGKADIFIYIGACMEPWIKDLLNTIHNDSLTIIEAAHGVSLIKNEESPDTEKEGHFHHQHEGFDPHIWLDFRNDQIIIDKILNVFSERDPHGKNLYIRNALKYKKGLADLDKRFAERLSDCNNQEIIIGGHAAFAYMARRYDLKQASLYGMNPDAEPSPHDMARLIDYARKREIKAVFFERLVNDRLAQVLADEIGAKTFILNPGPNLTKEEREKGMTFMSIMEENLKNLVKGLGCKGSR